MNQSHSLQHVFANRLFHIPDYQRGYSWEEKQWQDLAEDLDLLAADRQHYTGTLVLHERSNGSPRSDGAGFTYTPFDVVDGQQRLTTLLILVNAISREMRTIPGLQPMADGLALHYLFTLDRSGQPLQKLTLNRDCQPFFSARVLALSPDVDGPRIRSHRLLADASDFFARYLSSKQQEMGAVYAAWLESLAHKITQQLTFLIYTVGSEADAGVIFETMNNRGKPISEMEKVKNYLLYLSSKLELPEESNLAGEINDTWTHIFERLMTAGLGHRDHEDQLLRAHWLMAHDYDLSRWENSGSIKKKFSLKGYRGEHPKLLADIRSYEQTLAAAVTAYCDIYSPTHSDAFSAFKHDGRLHRQVVRAAEKLSRLGNVAPFLPLLIAARLRHPADGAGYLETLGLCERFAFRVFHWAGSRSDTGRSTLYRYGNDLYQGETLRIVLDNVRRLLLEYCPDSRFEEEFRREGENWYHWSGIKYFLYEYEEHMAARSKLDVKVPWGFFSKNEQSIEHILPQHPGADGYWTQQFSDEQRKKYTNDLGNLCLTYFNGNMGNKPFQDKLGVPGGSVGYMNSLLFSEKALAGHSDWGVPELSARRAEIEGWALERWSVQAPPDPPATSGGLKAIEDLADQRSIGDTFQRVLSAGRSHGLYLRPFRWCVVFAPPNNHNRAVFTVWPKPGKLEVGLWSTEGWEPSERFVKILGPATWREVTDQNVEEFVIALDKVFDANAETSALNSVP